MKSLKNIFNKALMTLAIVSTIGIGSPLNQNKSETNKTPLVPQITEQISPIEPKEVELNKPDPIEINKIYLTSCVDNQTSSTKSKNIKLENKVNLNLVIESEENGKKVYFSNSKNIEINGKKIDSLDIRKGNLEDISINWFKVEAEGNNYSNVGGSQFSWDNLTYKETPINKGNKWSLQVDARPTDKSKDVNKGLGTMRYKVEIIYNDKKISSPGKSSTNYKGITEDVHRISVRKDDSFIGWVTSYFNLPYIYGSSGETNSKHQTEKYIGSDCADLLVGAYRKTGKDISYTCAAGLTKFANVKIAEERLSTNGENYYYNNKLVKFGSDVQVGDLILFGRSHVGVIVEDKSNPYGKYKGGPDGLFNDYDLIIHTLFDTPKKESLERFGGGSILRWKK